VDERGTLNSLHARREVVDRLIVAHRRRVRQLLAQVFFAAVVADVHVVTCRRIQ